MWLIVLAATAVNYYGGFGIGGTYAKLFMIVPIFGVVIWAERFGPTMHDLHAHKRLKRWRENALQRQLDGDAER